jgi:hypothetical protein
MCLQYILVRFIPTIILPPPPTPFLEQFQQISLFYPHIWIQNISIIFTLSLCSPTLVPSPRKELLYPPVLHFLLKCILLVQGGFTLALPACIYHALSKLIPSPHYLLILYHHASLIFNNLQSSTLYYIQIWVGHFNIFHSLTFSFLLLSPIIPSDRPRNTILFHPFTCKQYNSIHFYGWLKLHCVYIPHFLNPFISRRTSGLFPKLGYYE